MKKKIIASVVCFLLLLELAAQNVVGTPGQGLDMHASPGGFVKELPLAPAETKGDVYLNSEWGLADIKIFNQNSELKDYPVKVNLKTNDLEINHQNQVRVLSGRSVGYFTLKQNNGATEKYVNGKKYKLNDTPIGGFLKVIDSSNWELLSKTQLKLVKSNYVAALDAGDRSDRIVKEEIFFLSNNNKLYQVFSSSKKFSAQFGDVNGLLIKEYIKSQKLNLKNQLDLLKLQLFLNEKFTIS